MQAGVVSSSTRCTEIADSGKRCRLDGDASDQPLKYQHWRSSDIDTAAVGVCGDSQSPGPLPSPSLTRSDRGPPAPLSRPGSKKRKTQSPEGVRPSKRARIQSEPVRTPPLVDTWLSTLPPTPTEFEHWKVVEDAVRMSQPPSKRSRSSDSVGRGSSQSGDGSETVVSRDRKYSVYKDANYPVVMETKGSYMRPSKAGMLVEDRELCDKLLDTARPLPQEDMLFDDVHFGAFHANLRGRSEARICTDLHPRVMPSAENLAILGSEEYEGLIEGHNDPWIKAIPFYGPRPQPDHTFGYRWVNFTEEQRRKLQIESTKKSFYTAREDIYFPFLTGEVKCGKQGLDLADRPNAHSMTVVMRGIVEIYRRLNRAGEVHGRVLGFSISHDDTGARLYAHYPEIDEDRTTYWRETLSEFSFGSNKGRERWKCYQFTVNVCTLFALPFLERLKKLIDELPDPNTQSFGLATTHDEVSVQDDASAFESQDESSMKPPSSRGLNAELRHMIQGLQRQLAEQQAQSREQLAQSKRQMTMLERQMAEQLAQSKEQMATLERRMVEQQKQSKEQTTEQLEQYKGQVKLLKQLLERL